MILRGDQITDHPWSGRVVPEYHQEDIRGLIEKPYRIIYHVDRDQMLIVTVYHGAQLLPALLDDT